MGYFNECKPFTGLIAASLYEPLDSADAASLAAHLEACPHCKKEAEALKGFVEALPHEPVVFEGDLLPVIREKLREEASSGSRGWLHSFGLRPAYWAVAAMLPLAVLGYVLLPMMDNAGPQAPMQAVVGDTTIQDVLAESDMLVSQRAFGPALAMLEAQRDALTGHAEVGRLQQAIADLEFNHLRRYPEAYAAYMTLQGDYWQTFRENSEHSARLNLLAEAREYNFEPLYTLDAAVDRDRADAFPQLEGIVARHEGQTLAWRAVEAMQDIALREMGLDPATAAPELRIAALEMLSEESANGAVAAHMNLALGDTYRNEYNNTGKARDHYRQVLQSGIEQLAQQAERSLTELADAR